MSDLDDEEFLATRKLNGVDDGLFKEKTADEMFEELGYEKIVEHKYKKADDYTITQLILYRDNVTLCEIEFWDNKTISKSCECDFDCLTIPELKAINKKCKELNWNE